MNPQLDPQTVALAKAIRQVESGGNYAAQGGSKEKGGYQYTPETWKGAASKYGVNVPLEQASPLQQNEVTYKRLKDWKDAGYNVGQIASMWNAGEGRPNAYKENWRGVNEFGVAYDTPAYAKKVATAYQGMKGQVVPTAQAATTEPAPVKEPFSLKTAAAAAISPVATMIARPFQALQLGGEMLRQSKENPELEASSNKYADEAYKLIMQSRTMPEGPEKQSIVQKATQLSQLGQSKAKQLSENAAYQPFSTDTLIKPAPQNFGDVKKDIGRGIQTVAFGMGPVSGGAAFGTGMSLEEGNDLLSFDTALYTLFGAAGGKALDVLGKPILNATGKVIGKVTPQLLQEVAKGGAKSVQAFMTHNKLLPDVLAKPLNRGADLLETGANAPFKAAAAPFKQTDDKIIATREKALSDLEEKYAQLRENAARNPKSTAETRARVARSNVLTEEGMVNDDGVIIGAKEAARQYRKQTIGEGESLVKQMLKKEGVAVDLNVVEKELERVMRESFNGRELVSALNGIRREMAGLRLASKDGRISLVDLHNAKVARQPGSKAYDNSETKALDKQIARAHRQAIEKNSKQNIAEINAEIGKYLNDAEYIESLLGKRIGSGKLGKAVSGVGGAVAGAVAGGALGGLPGVAVGSYVGGSVSRKLASRGYRKAFGKPTKQLGKANALFDKARGTLKEKQLALPPGSKPGTPENPIISGPAKRAQGPIAVKAPKGEAFRNPKTGKFEKSYLSTTEPLPTKTKTPESIARIKDNAKRIAAFERAPKLSNEYRKIEKKAFRKILQKEDELLTEYNKIKDTAGGKVINTDIFRRLFKDEGYAGHNAAAVQEPASYLSKKAYTAALKNNPGDTVIFTSGGSGTGKSSALKGIGEISNDLGAAAVVLDSNLSNYGSAIKKVTEALDANKKVVIDYVYRDPLDSFENGVVKRMKNNKDEGGRLVPSHVIADNHIESLKVAKQLHDEGIPVNFIDNSNGPNGQRVSSYEEISKKANYPTKEELTKKFNNIAKKLYEQKDANGTRFISKEEYEGYIAR